mgnify:CR=1 FL=1
METTSTLGSTDGSIEGAIASMIQPDEGAPIESEAHQEETEVESLLEDATLDEEEEETEEVEEEQPDEDEDEDETSDEETDDSDEDEEDTEIAEDKQEQQSFTVKVDGKNTVVTLDELKQGYSGQKYIQKGMQEASEARKSAEQVYSALLHERQQIAQVYEQAINGQITTAPAEPGRDLFETDPIGYMDAKLKYDEQMTQYQGQMQQMEAVAQQQSAATQAAQQAYLQHEMANLQKAMPEFADTAKASAIRDQLMVVGESVYGYDANEISQVMDHRAIRVLHDAMKYQELVNGKKAAEEKADPAKRRKRPIKSGSKQTGSNNTKRKKARQTLNRTGSVQDAIALLID